MFGVVHRERKRVEWISFRGRGQNGCWRFLRRGGRRYIEFDIDGNGHDGVRRRRVLVGHSG